MRDINKVWRDLSITARKARPSLLFHGVISQVLFPARNLMREHPSSVKGCIAPTSYLRVPKLSACIASLTACTASIEGVHLPAPSGSGGNEKPA